MKRKLISTILALALCAALSVPAMAETVPKTSEDEYDQFVNSVDIGVILSQTSLSGYSASPDTYYVAAPATVTVKAPAVGVVYKGKFAEYSTSPGSFYFECDVVNDEYVRISPTSGSWVDLHPGAEWVAGYGSDPRPHWSVGSVFTLAEGVYMIGNNSPVDQEFYLVVGSPPEAAMDSSKSTTPAAPPTPVAPAANTVSAKPTASRVVVDGKNLSFDAYNINGNNYFKLRDLAYALNGSPTQFDVGWNGANNAIALTSGKPYTAVGGEMASSGAGDKTATPTSSKITLNGGEVSLTAYNIGGNNYFKLRDIAQTFDFGVFWDSANNMIFINAGSSYTPE
jgi:hypothetical protein